MASDRKIPAGSNREAAEGGLHVEREFAELDEATDFRMRMEAKTPPKDSPANMDKLSQQATGDYKEDQSNATQRPRA